MHTNYLLIMENFHRIKRHDICICHRRTTDAISSPQTNENIAKSHEKVVECWKNIPLNFKSNDMVSQYHHVTAFYRTNMGKYCLLHSNFMVMQRMNQNQKYNQIQLNTMQLVIKPASWHFFYSV